MMRTRWLPVVAVCIILISGGCLSPKELDPQIPPLTTGSASDAVARGTPVQSDSGSVEPKPESIDPPEMVKGSVTETPPITYTSDGNPCLRESEPEGSGAGMSFGPFASFTASDPVSLTLDHEQWVSYAEFVPPDDLTIVTWGRDDGVIRIWDASTGNLLRELDPSPDESFILPPAIDLEGHAIVTVTGENPVTPVNEASIRLYDAATGIVTQTVDMATFDPDPLHALAYNGEFIALAVATRTHLWDAASGSWMIPFEGEIVEHREYGSVYSKGHAMRINALDFSPNGQALVSASADGTLRLWDVRTGEQLRCFESPQVHIRFQSAGFSADGRKVIGASPDLVVIWDATTSQPERAISYPKLNTLAASIDNSSSYFTSATFGPTSVPDVILTSEYNQTARVWSTQTGELLRLMIHPSGVQWAKFSADGNRVITALGGFASQASDPADHGAWIWNTTHRNLELAAKAEKLFNDGVEAAFEGKADQAKSYFDEAEALSPSPGVQSMLAAARDGMLHKLIEDALASAINGEIEQALASHVGAKALDPNLDPAPSHWLTLCRYISLWGDAESALTYCDQAIAVADDDHLPYAYDSRGIAHALIGDYTDAIADLEHYIANIASIDFFAEEGIEERQEWIKELEAEQNPFDEATLDSLRNRRYWWLPRLQGEAIEGN